MCDFEELYSWVKDLPIVDWHNHLDMSMLAEDKPLGSLYEVWVKSDPYKHRAMRICGEPEHVSTGDAGEDEKWAAWMRTLPKLVGNPLFTWARMELEWLGLDPLPYLRGTGDNVSLSNWTPSKLLKRFNVEYLSPCVQAEEEFFSHKDHKERKEELFTNDNCHNCSQITNTNILANSGNPTRSTCSTRIKILPSLRLNAGDEVSGETLEKFHEAGCRVVDISVDDVTQLTTYNSQLSTVAAYAAAHGWTMLLHLGALRETSERLRAAAGPTGGFAGMRAPVDPAVVATFLNGLERTPSIFSHKDHNERKEELFTHDNCHNCSQITNTNHLANSGISTRSTCSTRLNNLENPVSPVNPVGNSLPRTILLSLNPEAHAQLAVLAGSFVEEGMPGKVQLGPAWWWCDHEEGIRDVLEKNAAYGVLSTFIGMTTDSRSLLSFVRHDYFRRILCKWVAEKVASGAFPDDEALLRPMLGNICYKNAREMVLATKIF